MLHVLQPVIPSTASSCRVAECVFPLELQMLCVLMMNLLQDWRKVTNYLSPDTFLFTILVATAVVLLNFSTSV